MCNIIYLTRDLYKEFEQGIDGLKPRKMTKDQIKLMFRVLLSGAFRISEVLGLKASDILPNGQILLRETKTGWERCKCSKWSFRPTRLIESNPNCKKCLGIGKYRIDQYGWVSPEIFEELQSLAKNTPPDKRLFPITRRQAFNYAQEIANARTNTFRHTWLTRLIETKELDLGQIRQKSRHTNLETLTHYIETNKDLARIREQEALNIPGVKPKKADLF